jgi:hypothetical protein
MDPDLYANRELMLILSTVFVGLEFLLPAMARNNYDADPSTSAVPDSVSIYFLLPKSARSYYCPGTDTNPNPDLCILGIPDLVRTLVPDPGAV